MWGTATSSYQIEGNNDNSDWWQWEKSGRTKELSGIACDYWNRFREDHKLLSDLGVNTFRLSVEWARVEPEEGYFSQDAIGHYREILADIKSRNIKIQLTLWHWTSPQWFADNYGFHHKKSVELFSRYVEEIVNELGEFCDFYIVLNEPMVPLGMGYLAGTFPPGFRNPWKFWRALSHLAKAYNKSYQIIHDKNPNVEVGISYLYNWYDVDGLGFIEKIANKTSKWYRIDMLGNKIKDNQDYVGIDYYRLGKIIFNPKNSEHLGFRIKEDPHSPMRWVTYSRGMHLVLKEAYAKYKKPIYVIENGVPTNLGIEDAERVNFIKTHLKEVHRAIENGVPVRGYNYWSLIDNFEWLEGYNPRFGLYEIDRKTLQRIPRKSAKIYGKICREGSLEV